MIWKGSCTDFQLKARKGQPAHVKAASGVLEPHTVAMIGVPMRYGQPREGTELGPRALREAGMNVMIQRQGWVLDDIGDITLPVPLPSDPVSPLGSKRTYIVCRSNELVAEATAKAAKAGQFALTLGGDHSIAMGSIAGVLAARPNLGVVWVDAHADINHFDFSPSGNIHGMPVSFLARLIDPMKVRGAEWMAKYPKLSLDRLVYIGLRDLDTGEKATIKKHGIKSFTMHHLDKYGIGKVMEMTLDHLAKTECSLHLSWDIDALDPSLAPSTGTTVKGGLSFREAHFVAEAVAETGYLGSMDLVEVNPLVVPGVGADTTTKMGIQIVQSALGSNILDNDDQ